MALTNIFREPKRELIEQGIGFIVIILFAVLDYVITKYACKIMGVSSTANFIQIAMVAPFALVIFGYFLSKIFLMVHVIGEGICNVMNHYGYDPRPRRRY